MGNNTTDAKYMRVLTIMLLVALIACTTMLTACGSGAQIAKSGDNVSVLYVGTLDNGSVFQSSTIGFVIGAHKVLTDFENAVINMSVNQSKTIHIPVKDAYGPSEVTFNLSSTDTPPILGQKYTVQLDNGKYITAVAANVTDATATFQNIHALAGQNLTFQITLAEIVSSK